MEKLQEAKLYGNGLVEIDSPEIIARYNLCLDSLGLPQTRLPRFRIDGVGWSPEVAAELDNPHYLSHGDASPLAILLTPDQHGKPVYLPYYSYQRQLMREYWSRYAREIADLTSQAGICIELDHGISRHKSPLDLLLLQDVTVRTTVPGQLLQGFNEQRALIAEFSSSNDAWFNADLREAIIRSAKQYGDLRSHHFLIPEWTFTQTDFFRTSAFGGLFVLRGLHRYKNVLIHEDPDLNVQGDSPGTTTFALNDRRWLRLLFEEGALRVNSNNPKKLREDVRRLKECILADAACIADPQLDFTSLNAPQRKGLANRLGRALPDDYHDLERVELMLDGTDLVDTSRFPIDVQYLLCQPSPDLPHDQRKVLGQLLARYRPNDIWRLYRHNKHCFYEQYQEWAPSKKNWAIQLIKHHLDNDMSD